MQNSLKSHNKKFLPGNITPHNWFKLFRGSDRVSDFTLIALLSDIVAWRRNGTNDYFGENAPKFDGKELSIPYNYFEEKYGLHPQRIRRNFIKLEKLSILKRTLRNIELASGARVNRIFITLNADFFESCFRDSEIDIRASDDSTIKSKDLRCSKTSKDDNANLQSDSECRHHISNKTFLKKNRSTKIYFCKNIFEAKQIKSRFAKARELKGFYPLTQEDCCSLQSSSNRDFSLNAMNEILSDMSKRLSTRYFNSKNLFLSYMSKVFAYEMRDTVKVNNENFKIRNNQYQEEIDTRVQEKYLTKIEYSLEVSPEWHFRKKLAAVLEPKTAYKLLKAYKSVNKLRGTFYLHLSKHVELTDLDKKIILNQIKATHENIDFKDENLGFINEFQIIMPARQTSHLNKNDRTEYEPQLPTNVWGTVRSKLIDLLYQGKWVDRNWFSKLEASIDEETKEIKLKAPNNFVRDWVFHNYQHLIEQTCLKANYRLAGVIA